MPTMVFAVWKCAIIQAMWKIRQSIMLVFMISFCVRESVLLVTVPTIIITDEKMERWAVIPLAVFL